MGTTSTSITAAGTYAWTIPAGVTEIIIECWGGGGAGGAGVGSPARGGGGAGGQHAKKTLAVLPAATYTFIVAATVNKGNYQTTWGLSMGNIKIILIPWVLLISVVIAYADSAINSLAEHTDVLTWLIGGLFVIISYLIIRVLKKIDGNQNAITERINKLCDEFHVLQGEHNATMNSCEHNRRKDDLRYQL